jgi:hypothetical protein
MPIHPDNQGAQFVVPDEFAFGGRFIQGPDGSPVGFTAPHDHLVARGLKNLKGTTSRIRPAMQAAARYQAGASSPEDMIRVAAAQAVNEEVQHRGTPNTQTLYRGGTQDPEGLVEFTPRREVAEKFASTYRGEVEEFPPGSVHGISVGDYINSTIDQSEKSFLGYRLT